MKQTIFFILFVFFAFSCSSKSIQEYSVAAESEDEYVVLNEDIEDIVDESVSPPPPPAELKQQAYDKKIIKNGELNINVKSLKAEKRNVDSLVKVCNAYYDNERLSNNDSQTDLYLTIRIPSAKFEFFIESLEKGDNEISYKVIDAQDVTEKFVDLETRLANKRKYMTRYQELLTSAKSVKDVLEIQEKIRALEEEIESVTGRLKYLSHQVSLSTLLLQLSEKKDFKYTPEKRAKVVEKLKQSFAGGWHMFTDFLFILLYNWVFLIVISGGVYLWIRKRRKRNAVK